MKYALVASKSKSTRGHKVRAEFKFNVGGVEAVFKAVFFSTVPFSLVTLVNQLT